MLSRNLSRIRISRGRRSGKYVPVYRDFEKDVNKVRDIGLSKKLNPELKPFNQWLAENANRIPLD